jgi:hypothetical protein
MRMKTLNTKAGNGADPEEEADFLSQQGLEIGSGKVAVPTFNPILYSALVD